MQTNYKERLSEIYEALVLAERHLTTAGKYLSVLRTNYRTVYLTCKDNAKDNADAN